MSNTAELIRVVQLPEIEEHLQSIKIAITQKVNDALSLVCTEDTVKSVKAVRADLNKELKEFEEQRKAVKKAVCPLGNQAVRYHDDCRRPPHVFCIRKVIFLLLTRENKYPPARRVDIYVRLFGCSPYAKRSRLLVQ